MMMSPRCCWIVVVVSSAVILATNTNAIASLTTTAEESAGEIGRRRHDGFDAWLLAHKKENHAGTTTTTTTTGGDNYYNYQERLDIWLNNAATVDAHNRAYDDGYTAFKMSVEKSPFADLTDEEFARDYLMEPQQKCSATSHRSSGRLRPQHSSGGGDTAAIANSAGSCHYQVDWRTKGIVTPIKNQRSCGSCWTFSTTGCLEAHLCKAAKKDCTHWSGLAEQQLVDCAGDYNNDGCNGGLPSQAFEYIKYNGGIDLETSYPYVGTDGTCRAKETGAAAVGGKVAEVFNITSKDEEDLVYAVAHVGPVSVAYQVSANFRFYSHGVYDSYDAATNTTQCKSESYDVNHAVVAVGLDSTDADDDDNGDGVPFYIVRNSWGTSWGMEDYFWMKRGQNLCGVSDCASFPLVPSSSSQNNNNNAANAVDNGDTGTTATTTSTTAAMLRASSSRTK